MRTVLKHRTLGVAFVVLMLLAVYLVNAIFNQKFTSFDRVRLDTDNIGLQLPSAADVKIRGEIVGQVLTTRTRKGGGAQMVLGLDPKKIGAIPANVGASILPKTLFGEKYVSLTVPAKPSSKALRTGDLIAQTKLPIEVEKVLSDIYPLLRTVQPAELNYTLNALATALEGRGDELGNNLEVLNSYLVRMNPKLPKLIADLKLLGTVSDTYADVTPELAATLRNTVKTGNTLLSRQDRLNAFLKDTTSFSNTARTFLDNNGDNIVALGQVSEPTLALLKEYSPEFPCMLGGIVKQASRLAETFRGFVFHINLVTLPKQPRGYNAGDVPVFAAKNSPYCGTLPNSPYSPDNIDKTVPNFADGVPEGNNDLKRAATGFDRTAGIQVTGTKQEKALMVSLAAPVLGVPADRVGDITTLLFGPLARGSEVSVK
jgi:phospholipid/cholesterol/gamma-HCH transport system substrate-binding protein